MHDSNFGIKHLFAECMWSKIETFHDSEEQRWKTSVCYFRLFDSTALFAAFSTNRKFVLKANIKKHEYGDDMFLKFTINGYLATHAFICINDCSFWSLRWLVLNALPCWLNVLQLSVDYITDKTAAEERIRMYARFRVYTQISVDLVRLRLVI